MPRLGMKAKAQTTLGVARCHNAVDAQADMLYKSVELEKQHKAKQLRATRRARTASLAATNK